MTDPGAVAPVNPDSVVARKDGSLVPLKVHSCVWSGRHPPNSLAAVRECHAARVAWAEVDLWLLADADGVIDHDGYLQLPGRLPARPGEVHRDELLAVPPEERPPLLSELVEVMRDEPHRTRMEIDLKDEDVWPAERVAEIVARLGPIRDRVTLAGAVAETVRRIAAVDPRTSTGFNPEYHLDWLPAPHRGALAGRAGRDGWLNRTGEGAWPARLAALRDLAPAARELHLRLEALERMLIDAGGDPVGQLHADGWFVDAWTLDAGTPGWHQRMEAALAAGVDMITTNTAPALARAHRERHPA